RLPPAEIACHFGASGYVVDTVPLALHCAQDIATSPLSSVLARAISAGGDTDTIASITGQIAGTVTGSQGIPPEQVDQIKEGDLSRSIVGDFSGFIATRPETFTE